MALIDGNTSTNPSTQASHFEDVPDALRRPGPTIGAVGISVALHAGILGLFACLTWAVGDSDRNEKTYRAQIIAATPPGAGGGFRFPGQAFIDRPDSAKSQGQSDESELRQALAATGAQTEVPRDRVGTGLAEALDKSLSRADIVGIGDGGGQGGLGSGLGDRELAGGGPVGSLWGVGEGQKARTIVYVLDRSGSMSDTFEQLQGELMNAIGSLQADQEFNVIWFNEGKGTEVFPRMAPATIENKQVVFAAIRNIVPSGRTEPLDAIRKGMGFRPDVLYLLSDGDFGEQNEQIIRSINHRNRKQRTIINTILFVYDNMGDGERVLRAIAESNGGVYKHVTEDEISR